MAARKTTWLLQRGPRGSNWFQIAQVVVPLSAVIGGVFFTYKGIRSQDKAQWEKIKQEAENKKWLERVKRERREKMLQLQRAERTSQPSCACPDH